MIPPIVTIPPQEKPLHHHAWQLVVGVVALVLVLAVAGVLQIRAKDSVKTPEDPGLSVVDTRPPFTEEVQKQLAESKGFAVLISYTDRGFESAKATIHRGESVRFTNNSSAELWVVAHGAVRYPAVADGCGDSALDSCKAIGRGEFWEVTFEEAGAWEYRNKLVEGDGGVVTVGKE